MGEHKGFHSMIYFTDDLVYMSAKMECIGTGPGHGD